MWKICFIFIFWSVKLPEFADLSDTLHDYFPDSSWEKEENALGQYFEVGILQVFLFFFFFWVGFHYFDIVEKQMIKLFFAKQCLKLSKEMPTTLSGGLFQHYVQ